MSCYLGPELPQPFAVLSERYQRFLPPIVNETQSIKNKTNKQTTASASPSDDRVVVVGLGKEYAELLSHVIQCYAEIDMDDLIGYIGPDKGAIVKDLEKVLRLLHPIQHISVGKVLFHELPNFNKSLAVTKVSVGAEEYFCESAKLVKNHLLSPMYDRLIVRDTLEYLDDRKTFFKNIMTTIRPLGHLLLIHRPFDFLSLPYYEEVNARAKAMDISAGDLIEEFNSMGYEVEWEIELVPIRMTSAQWKSSVYHKYPNHLEFYSPCDVVNGLRELSEGPLKYIDNHNVIELLDRILLLRVGHTNPLEGTNPPPRRMAHYKSSLHLTTTRQQQQQQQQKQAKLGRLPITDEWQNYLDKMTNPPTALCKQRPSTARPEWFGTVSDKTLNSLFSTQIPSARLNHFLT